MKEEGLKIGRRSRHLIAASIAFFVVTSLTISWTRFGGGLALLWPGSAILTALLVTLPTRGWIKPIALFTALSAIATAVFGFGPKVALPLAVINVFESVVIARILLGLRPQADWLESVPGLERMIVSIVIGTCLAAIPGGILAAWVVAGSWQYHVFEWLAGHALGSLLCFPLAYMFTSGLLREKLRYGPVRSTIECGAHCVVIAAFCWIAFFHSSMALLFLPIVPLMYGAFRAGRVGAVLGLLVIAGMGAISLQSEIGVFSEVQWSLTNEVKFLQFYLAILLILALPLSVALKQHKLVMAELDEIRTLESLVADHSDDVLINLDASGRIRYCSSAGMRLNGGSDPTGEPLGAFFDPLDEPLVQMALAKAAENPAATHTLERAVTRYDDVVWLETKIRAVPGANAAAIAGYAVTIRDVTARKHTELNAVREAETDSLTGLPNRRALMRYLDPRLESASKRPLTVAIIDLDHFKAVNDTHGHNAGDTTLREVARAMRRIASPSIFFARLGGEEFAMVIEQSSLAEAIDLASSLRSAIGELRLKGPDGKAFEMTASIGMARIDQPVSTGEALRMADIPLYSAKSHGRNRIEIGSMMHEERKRVSKVSTAWQGRRQP